MTSQIYGVQRLNGLGATPFNVDGLINTLFGGAGHGAAVQTSGKTFADSISALTAADAARSQKSSTPLIVGGGIVALVAVGGLAYLLLRK